MFRKRCFERKHFFCPRVSKSQAVSVKKLAFFIEAFVIFAIKRVAFNGVTNVIKMNANLMRSPSEQPTIDERKLFAKTFFHLEISDGFFSFFYPILKLKLAAHPFPIKPATALQKITIGNITLVAAFPKYPTP